MNHYVCEHNGYNWSYKFTAKGDIVIEASNLGAAIWPQPKGTFEIPKVLGKHYGKKIVAIGRGAFIGCSELVQLDVSDDIYYIGPKAFKGCRKLKSVNDLRGCRHWHLAAVCKTAFENCPLLDRTCFCNGIPALGEEAFKDFSGVDTIVPIWDRRRCVLSVENVPTWITLGAIRSVFKLVGDLDRVCKGPRKGMVYVVVQNGYIANKAINCFNDSHLVDCGSKRA